MSNGNQQIALKTPAELLLLRQTVYATALESYIGKSQTFANTAPEVLLAQAEIARNIPKRERTPAERELAHMLSSIIAVENAVNDNLVATQEEAEKLTDVLVFSDINPTTAIKYLRPGDYSRLSRALTPTELATAVAMYDDISYEDSSVSIATIVLAAEASGISLDGPVSDDDLAMISARIELYDATVELSVVDDDPKDGPIPGRKKREISSSAPLAMRDSAVNPLTTDEASITIQTRIADFSELSGVPEAELYRTE